MAVAPSPSGCFSFDAGKVDCYFMRLLTTSIHSNHRQSRQNISGLPYLSPCAVTKNRHRACPRSVEQQTEAPLIGIHILNL